MADSQEQISGWVAVGRAVFAARNNRIERVRPIFVEVRSQTFDEAGGEFRRTLAEMPLVS